MANLSSEKFPKHICFAKERYPHLIKAGFNPKTILDIGANYGQWFSLARPFFHEAEILSIEANPKNYEILSQINPNSKTILLGEEEKEEVEFFDSAKEGKPGCGGASIYKEDSRFYEEVKPITLPMKTLDSLNLEFDFIKIDTQGSELDILRGGLGTIERCTALELELGVLRFNKGAPLANEVIAYLNKIGFYFYEILSHFYWGDRLSQFNALFINQRFSHILDLD